jgi:2-aminoadipate transaminase
LSWIANNSRFLILPWVRVAHLATHILAQIARRIAADWQERYHHPLYLLEDAAYRELRFEGDDVKSALVIKGHRDRVIYAGTYSKPFATGTRVGFGLVPEPVLTAVLRIKGNHDFGSSNLLQQLLAQSLASGLYEQHLAVLRKRYAHKARLMLAALRQHFPADVEWWEPPGVVLLGACRNASSPGRSSKVFQGRWRQRVVVRRTVLCK